MTRWDLLNRGWRGENSRNFCVEVGTHRPDACVSAEEKAEESEVLRWRGGNSRKLFWVEVRTHRPKTRVSPLWRRLRKRGVTVGPLRRGWRGGFFCNFLEDVGTHRPQARVSAVEKAEEAWDF